MTQLDANSVKFTHIVNEQVKGLDVRDNSLTKDDILDRSLEQDAYAPSTTHRFLFVRT